MAIILLWLRLRQSNRPLILLNQKLFQKEALSALLTIMPIVLPWPNRRDTMVWKSWAPKGILLINLYVLGLISGMMNGVVVLKIARGLRLK